MGDSEGETGGIVVLLSCVVCSASDLQLYVMYPTFFTFLNCICKSYRFLSFAFFVVQQAGFHFQGFISNGKKNRSCSKKKYLVARKKNRRFTPNCSKKCLVTQKIHLSTTNGHHTYLPCESFQVLLTEVGFIACRNIFGVNCFFFHKCSIIFVH